MARILASSAAASAALGSSWLFGLCMVVFSVWLVSFAVFICGRTSGDDRPRKKPAPAPATNAKPPASRGTASAGHGGGGCGGGGGGCGC
ncbi:hypothetical protein SETIT_2G247500v2 [Setaria italica]|uniref:Uncharacterized protein n=1 Tax=Setaria italica TaxID=4555 RepID=A0A368Q2Q3_SETIT|nr:hypothetical protein SETIT_2G247500v2 [Setaria italica]